MTRSLDIHVNRTDHHDVETRTKRFAPDGPFEVHVQNHGEGLHVHVVVTGDLAIESAQFDGNPYVEGDSTLELPVSVTTDVRPASGTVEVTTGYGRNGVSVDVDVVGDSADASGGRAAADRSTSGSAVRSAGTASADSSGQSVARPTGDDSSTSRSSGGTASSGASADGSAAAGATAAIGTLVNLPAVLAARASGAAGRSSRVTSRDSSSDADAPTAADTGGTTASFDAGTVLLVALALLATCAAGAAFVLFSGPAVALGVAAVFLTVIGVGLYLVR